MAVSSWIAGSYLVPRYGHRIMFVGAAFAIAGLAAAALVYRTAVPTEFPVPLLGALAVLGIGVGLFTPAFFMAALHSVTQKEVGSAAGLLNAVQQLGSTFGVAVLGSLYIAGGGLRAAEHCCMIAITLVAMTSLFAAAVRL
ncbi:MFS transporter [Antrihabitans cavernicola]|uniref:MFS transporter n=1 Tax=Antrihabitans cavernicola TaxID=2495913 RepID=UPI001BE4955C|nr:MFS transporter [Spelaeibacter cavernicola]